MNPSESPRPAPGPRVPEIAADDRRRVVIDTVRPEVDCGRFAIKRVVGEQVEVEAVIFADGHDRLSAALLYRRGEGGTWIEVRMEPSANDVWRAAFAVTELGNYYYTIRAWIDDFRSWRDAFAKKVAAGQDTAMDCSTGAELVALAAKRAQGEDSARLERFAAALREADADAPGLAASDELADLMARHAERRWASAFGRELRVNVERDRARFGAWYELFPRSAGVRAGVHGTFHDCIGRLPYIASMGFDVLYLPPIHPIGHSFRKGRNNSRTAEPDDVGSPWAIGSSDGGHKAIHSQLGTLADFRELLAKAGEHGMNVALDIALQCTPDHPYVAEHPDWFRRRPDGSIQYAENPPKKYEDIYPLDFESDDWRSLWQELLSVFVYWCEQGVRIFRVDNPHTKAFPFWEWVIAEIKARYPDALFLAEAFTRPAVMYGLAKLGFSQSYTYFAWRNTKTELTQYFTEITDSARLDFFRAHLWPNTPDILTEYLQFGGRPAFSARLILAATLGANYGIYGPAFELCENTAREPGSEEYLDSEKYELKHWDAASPDSLAELIALVNRIRRTNSALHSDQRLTFHAVDNDEMICFSKHTADLDNVIVVVVNLDPHHVQAGWVELATDVLGLDGDQPYQVHELLTGARYLWHGARNYVELHPSAVPAHIFRVRHRLRSERDFDYFQ